MKKRLTNLLLSLILLLGCSTVNNAQTTLVAGDIAFIGLYMDGLSTSGDGFTFILLKNLDAGTIVYFTDEGWDASANNTWYGNTNDAHISWTVSAGGLPIGTIVHIENTSTTAFSTTSGTVSATLSGVWNLSSSGDQMLAYQSSTGVRPASPVFITAIDADYYATYDGLDGWGSSYYNQSYCSYLPVGLTNGTNCLALVNGVNSVTGGYAVSYECDNYKYIGTLTGTVDEIRLAISTISNWIGNEDASTNIAVAAYPTPNITSSSTASTVTTQAVSSIATTTATGNGNITDLGSPNPTAHGVCWNTTGSPTIADSKVNNGPASLTGAFTALMTSLSPNTTYYVRAYATNTAGTSYGGEVSFTTSPLAPTVTTQAVSSIASATATGNGTITSLGAPNPTAHGVCWNTTGNPTVLDYYVNNGATSSTGAFTASITGLLPNTTYYVRAFATNVAGTSYGPQVSFTTSKIQLTISAPVISSKEYDGTNNALSHTTMGTVSGIQGGDAVTVNIAGSVYDNKNIGSGKTVTVTYSLSGAAMAKYIAPVPSVVTTGQITAKAITVNTNTLQTKVYGNPDPAFTYTVSPALFSGDSFAGALSRVAGENAGNYAITQGTLSAGTNYTISFVSENFVISPKAVTISVNPFQTKVYGNADPVFTYIPTPALVSGDSFSGSLTREVGEDVGFYEILQGTLTAGNNYVLTYNSDDFEITEKNITVTANANQTKIYGQSDPVFTYSVSPALISGDSFSGLLNRAVGESAGFYAIGQGTLSAGSNYNINFITDNFQITAKNIVVTADANQTKVYGESNPVYTYTSAPALISGDLFTGALSRVAGENVGNYAITQGTLSAGTNYTISFVSDDFEISAKAITVNANTLQAKVYGDIDPVFTYTASPALISGDSFAGALSRVAGENTGNYAITQGTLSAGTNYTISFVSENFVISPKAVTISVNPFQTKVYGDADPVFTYIPTPALVSGDSFSGSLTREVGEDVGFYEILQGTLTAGNNYVLTYNSDDFEITEKNITVTADANQTKVYGQSDPVFTYSVSPALISGDSFSGLLDRAVGESAGFYAIGQGTLSAGANYNINFITDNFEITAKDIVVTADANQTKAYGQSDPIFTYTSAPALISGDSFSGSLSRLGGENVGFYAIGQGTLSAGSNYNMSFVSDDFEITAKAITVTADAGQTKFFAEIDPVFTYTTLPALESGDSFIGALSRVVGEDAGLYAIEQGSLSAGTNYDMNFVSNDFEILPKPITVTADAGQTKVYGATDPEFTYTFTPALESGDIFTGLPDREPGEDAGFYEILQGSLTAGNNYSINYNSDDFEITAIDITVTADANQTKIYGAADPEFTYTVSPDLNSGDTFTGLLSRAAGEDVGTYAIEQGTLSAGINYNLSFVPAGFEITVRDIVVTANAGQTKEYGDADPVFTYTVAPALYFGDELTGSLSRVAGENIGFYAIEQGTLSASGNYSMSYVPNDFEITIKNLSITDLVAESKVYDGNTTAVVNGGILNGVNGSEDVTVTMPTSGTFDDKNIGTDKVVSLENIVLLGSDAGNYILIQPIGLTANITAKELTVTGTFTVNNKQYDGTTAATISTNNLALNGVIEGETVELNPVAEFASIDVADNILVSLTAATTISGTDSGNYTLSLVDAPTTTASILPVSVNSVSGEVLGIYPNPFTDYICFSNAENVKSITITDAQGKLISAKTINGEERVNTENLPAGVYFVTVELNTNGKQFYKLVKF